MKTKTKPSWVNGLVVEDFQNKTDDSELDVFSQAHGVFPPATLTPEPRLGALLLEQCHGIVGVSLCSINIESLFLTLLKVELLVNLEDSNVFRIVFTPQYVALFIKLS